MLTVITYYQHRPMLKNRHHVPSGTNLNSFNVHISKVRQINIYGLQYFPISVLLPLKNCLELLLYTIKLIDIRPTKNSAFWQELSPFAVDVNKLSAEEQKQKYHYPTSVKLSDSPFISFNSFLPSSPTKSWRAVASEPRWAVNFLMTYLASDESGSVRNTLLP